MSEPHSPSESTFGVSPVSQPRRRPRPRPGHGRRRRRDQPAQVRRRRPAGDGQAGPDPGVGCRPRRGTGDPVDARAARGRTTRSSARSSASRRPRTGQGRRWVVDPIDGTKNFVRGVPVWATLIALFDGDDAVVGVVSAPALARRWWAAAGSGRLHPLRRRAAAALPGVRGRRAGRRVAVLLRAGGMAARRSGTTASRRWPRVVGGPGRTATSTPTCWSPRVRWTSRPNPS